MCLLVIVVVCFVSQNVLSISNNNGTNDLTTAIWELSNIAIQGRQNSQYYQNSYPYLDKYPSYSQYYKPQQYQYGNPQYYPQNYLPNVVSRPDYQYRPPTYPDYLNPSYNTNPSRPNPPFLQKTRESVMDALFSIAQNDDLQCVPKLLCEVTSGRLMGRQEGFNSPVNVNLESLTTFLSGLSSANMSPVLHFGKAAILGFASKSNPRTCQYSYPECPNDPAKLIQYLNNHNGGFFRFFKGLNPSGQNHYGHYAPQYFNGYRPGYFRNQALAEKRIQNQPSTFSNSNFDRENYYKEHRDVNFPHVLDNTPGTYKATGSGKIIFPSDSELPTNSYSVKSGAKSFKFPTESDHNLPYRRGKTLQFDPYLSQTNDNCLDIQRPLPNHVPEQNIFPDRTGTGELRLDFNDLENNYQQSVEYDQKYYNQLLYDSFPNDNRGSRRVPSELSFPAT